MYTWNKNCLLKTKDCIPKSIYKKNSDKITISSDRFYLNKRALKIIKYIENNERITNKEAREATGLSQSGVRKLLNQLVDKNILDAVGEKKNRYYVIKND